MFQRQSREDVSCGSSVCLNADTNLNSEDILHETSDGKGHFTENLGGGISSSPFEEQQKQQ